MDDAIQVSHLTKYYGKKKGIDDLSFYVKQGEIVGFIGPNGAGKSTTIRTLMALIQPDFGHATMLGRDCIKEAAVISKDVGYLPAELGFYENMRVSEFLKYTGDLYGMKTQKKTQELVNRLKLDTTRKLADLSYGNKKKVGIICALMHSPKLVLMDEATSGLDPLIQQIFFDILKEENERGMTILFSSHVLSEVQKICNRVVMIKEGALIEELSVHELLEKGYKKVSFMSDSHDLEELKEMKEVTQFQMNQQQISFLFYGKSSLLLQRLAKIEVEDILIQEPSLEEIFLHYYQ